MQFPAQVGTSFPSRSIFRSVAAAVVLAGIALGLAPRAAAEPTPSAGSGFRILHGDQEALQARIDLIQRAEQTIDLAYYIVDTDEVPIALLELLRQAANRGVRVRLLVDGFRSYLPSEFEQYLCRHGIKITVYHKPRPCLPAWLNQRIHSKLLVVDSAQAIVGSRNLQNSHFGMGRKDGFADCDVLVAGDVGLQIQHYFDWLWRSCDVESAPLDDSLTLDTLHSRPRGCSDWAAAWRQADCDCDYQRLLDRSIHRVTTCLGVTPCSDCDWLDGAIQGVEICLLHDRRTDKSTRHFQEQLIQMVDHAKCRVLIETPYPAFDKPTRSAISRARRRGVCVTILTNSLKTTDQLATYAAYQNQKRSLLREGVHLREYQGNRTLHAKTMIIDQSLWMIGSHNFDARSNRANLELAVVSGDRAGAEQLHACIQTRINQSLAIQPATLIPQVGKDWSLQKRARLMLQRSVVEAYRSLL